MILEVGGSLDKACKLEAMLHSLATRSIELKRDQEKVEKMSAKFIEDIKTEVLNGDDLTVVTGFNSMLPKDQEERKDKVKVGEDEQEIDTETVELVQAQGKVSHGTLPRHDHGLYEEITMRKIRSIDIQEQNRSLVCFAREAIIDSLTVCIDIDHHRGASNHGKVSRSGHGGLTVPQTYSHDAAGRSFIPRSMSSHSGLPKPRLPSIPRLRPRPLSDTHERLMIGSSSGESLMSMVSEDSRRVETCRATTGTDFRTGRSGHRGLTVPQTHSHDAAGRSFIPRSMSSHSGLPKLRLPSIPTLPWF